MLIYMALILVLGIWVRTELMEDMNNARAMDITALEDGDSISLLGSIYKMEIKSTSQYIYVEGVLNKYSAQEGFIDSKIEGKFIVIDNEYRELFIGQEIKIIGKIQHFSTERNPGNFDAKTYYENQGLLAMIYTESIDTINTRSSPIHNYLYQIKQESINYLYGEMGEDKGALLAAMIFGDKSSMNGEQKERFQKIGISHIFAISGLHISLLSLVLYTFLRKKTGSFLIAGSIAMIVLYLYIIMIGESISALRAGLMFAVKILGDISGRVYHRGIALAIPCIWILLSTPGFLYDGGFLLSFGAILSVIFLMPIYQLLLKKYGKIGGAIGASLAIQTMLLPVMFQNFYEVCIYSVAVNMLVISTMPILLGLGIMGVLLGGLFSGIGLTISTFLLQICGYILGLLDKLSYIVISLPFARFVQGKLWWPIIFLYYLTLIGLIIWGRILIKKQQYMEDLYGEKESKNKVGLSRQDNKEENLRKKQKQQCRLLALILCLLPLLLLIKVPRNELEITLIDVGQGDGIYISGPYGAHYLVDGGSTDVIDVGTYRIEPFLLSLGVSTLDYVFISHGDSDHMNGVATMLARQTVGVKIRNLVLVEGQFLDDKLLELMAIAVENGTKVLVMKAGNEIREGEMVITCLAPESNYSGEVGNASSMVLDLSYYDFDMLFTGDLENKGEEDFIEYLGAADSKHYEILKVSHHGSKNSTPIDFLEYIKPQIALISAGINSRYGHPHEETLERLAQYTDYVYSTSESGAISIGYNHKDSSIYIDEYMK